MQCSIYIILLVLINKILDSKTFDITDIENRSKNGARNTSSIGMFQPAAVPTNLTSTVSVFDATRKLLQLNVSWTQSQGQPANSYNLHIKSLNESDPYCTSEPYYAFIEEANQTQWLVSPKPLAMAVHQSNSPFIAPDCSYQIRLEANPNNGKTYTEIILTIPDCVEEVCSCRHASQLPKPILNIKNIDGYNVNITWFIAGHLNISSFNLRVGPQIINGPHSAVYNLSWFRNVPLTSVNMYNEIYKASGTNRHAAVLQVVDLRHCIGPEIQHTFFVEDITGKSLALLTRKRIWVILLPIGLCLIMFCLTTLLFGQKYFQIFKLKKNNSFVSHNFLYEPVNIKSERVFRRNTHNSIHEWNVLYIEKEIEDAKEQGKADVFEISYNRLTFRGEIGRGAFGQVLLAKAEAIRGVPGSRLVAVKKLKGTAGTEEKEEFLEEISMLKRVGQHPNVVSLLACCTLNSHLCMVMEFVPCGDLLRYLHNLREKLDARKPSITSMSDGMYSTPSTIMTSLNSPLYSASCTDDIPDFDYTLDLKELHNFALQIARGMAHLEKKRITHRDLAARNILIDHNKMLKISDFGLSRRGVYVNTRRRKVPLRWLSIEAMRDSLYSSKSDVWAFAILLWEIGGFPYPTVTDYDLLHYLKSGKRLEKPDIVSQNLYSVMLVCWSELADNRPSFAELVTYLEPNPNNHIYVEFSANHNLPPTCENVKIEKLSSRLYK